MRTLLKMLSFLFVLSLCVPYCKAATIDESSKISIHFLYGPGGPHRESLTCFSGEYIFMLVGIPRAIIPENSVATLDWIFESRSPDKPSFCNPRSVALRKLENISKQSSFRFVGLQQQIPSDCDGSYDLTLYIQCDNKIIAEKSVQVDIKGYSVFGLRNMTFLHGNIPITEDSRSDALAGSNIFMVGERIAIFFAPGGVSTIGNSKASKLHIKISLMNESNQSVIISDETRLYVNWRETCPSKICPSDSTTFLVPAALPGKFKVLIDVQNLDTQDAVKHELPLYIFDYACSVCLCPQGARGPENRDSEGQTVVK